GTNSRKAATIVLRHCLSRVVMTSLLEIDHGQVKQDGLRYNVMPGAAGKTFIIQKPGSAPAVRRVNRGAASRKSASRAFRRGREMWFSRLRLRCATRAVRFGRHGP